MSRSIIRNLVLLGTATLIALLAAELLMRSFTPFPIGLRSHMTSEPDLGYVLSTDFPGIDKNGFRNKTGEEAGVAAIGDSFTYGSNVLADRNWPALFASASGVNVYNYGISSYGMHSYHALVRRARRNGFKGAIVAVYGGNDFYPGGSYCHLAREPSAFWQSEKASLGLTLAPCEAAKPRDVANGRKLISFLKHNVAMVSAFDRLIWDRMYYRDGGTDILSSPDIKQTLRRDFLEIESQQTDLSNPDIAGLFSDFEKMVGAWDRLNATDFSIGILFIPSRHRIVYDVALRKQARRADSDLKTYARQEARIEEKIRALANNHRIAFASALQDMGSAMIEQDAQGEPLFQIDDLHPREAGYVAIAHAAHKLWKEMAPKKSKFSAASQKTPATSSTE